MGMDGGTAGRPSLSLLVFTVVFVPLTQLVICTADRSAPLSPQPIHSQVPICTPLGHRMPLCFCHREIVGACSASPSARGALVCVYAGHTTTSATTRPASHCAPFTVFGERPSAVQPSRQCHVHPRGLGLPLARICHFCGARTPCLCAGRSPSRFVSCMLSRYDASVLLP